MPKNRAILILGVLIALLPVLGFPRAWESFFQVLAGFSIVLLSVWSTIDRKLSLKAKAQMRQTRKAVPLTSNASTEEVRVSGERVTDFYPKTAPPGRRFSDISSTVDPNLNQTDSDQSEN